MVFSFDCESIGLHGETFSVGWVVVHNGYELTCGHFTVPRSYVLGDQSDREWVDNNVPVFVPTHKSIVSLREDFWALLQTFKGATILTDCPWPVEANFLTACVQQDPVNRKFTGPYPLVDLNSVLVARGLPQVQDRLPNELPVHNPICDARQTARIWSKLHVM